MELFISLAAYEYPGPAFRQSETFYATVSELHSVQKQEREHGRQHAGLWRRGLADCEKGLQLNKKLVHYENTRLYTVLLTRLKREKFLIEEKECGRV